jgi:hypothetical protein
MKADDFAAPSGTSAKFEKVGDTVSGVITYVGDFQPRINKFNGREEEVGRIGIDTGDDEPVYVYPVKGSAMARAIADAMRSAGIVELNVGDTLKVKYSEDVDTGKPQPMKRYVAKVEAGAPEEAF